MMVKLEKYKVAYWTDGQTLKSKMFRSLSGARGFMKTLPKGTISTLMEAKDIGEGEYSWSVLSDGVGKYLPAMTKVFQNRMVIGLSLLGLYAITRKET